MADFKYKMDWVPEAKKLREQVSQSGRESMGIASKPKDEQPAMDQDFYESMYGAILQYFDKAEDADKVLSSKKPDRDRIREMTLGEFDELTLRSSEEAALQRMESRTTQSLVEGGSEAFRTKLPEGESLRPVLRDDSTKAEQESTPVTVETETEVPTGGLMSPRLDTKGETPVAESSAFDFTQFYSDIGVHAETDHGSTPQTTNDAREANLPESERSKDIGFGHKIKQSEDQSGVIHGIPFKRPDGSYIPLTDEQKTTILEQDMLQNLEAARADNTRGIGWDTKLANIGTTWDDLDDAYKAALTSLAYNVGGSAGRQWTNVLTAAKDKNLTSFARGLRRKDAGRHTAGMDNRVAKELYYAGLISNLSEVSDQLPLANANQAGIPE
jgi:hypothetical protein